MKKSNSYYEIDKLWVSFFFINNEEQIILVAQHEAHQQCIDQLLQKQMSLSKLPQIILDKIESSKRLSRIVNLIDPSISYDCKGISSKQWEYNSYFQEVIQQVSKATFIPYERIKDSDISLLGDCPHKNQVAGFNGSTIVLLSLERGGAVSRFLVSIGGFFVTIKMLNLNFQSSCVAKEDEFTKQELIEIQQSNKYLARRMYFGQSEPSLEEEDYTDKMVQRKNELNGFLSQYAFAKICSLLRIGPKIICPTGFNIIRFKDCLEYYLEMCYDYRYALNFMSFDRIEHRLKYCLRLLHEFNIIHGELNYKSIMFSEQTQDLVIFGFQKASAMSCPVGYLQSFEQKDSDPYWNDVVSLKEAICEIGDSTMTFSAYSSTKILSERTTFITVINKLHKLHCNGIPLKSNVLITAPYFISFSSYFPQLIGEKQKIFWERQWNTIALVQSAQLKEDLENFIPFSSLQKLTQTQLDKLLSPLQCYRNKLMRIARVIGCCSILQKQSILLLHFCLENDSRDTAASIKLNQQIFMKLLHNSVCSRKKKKSYENLDIFFKMVESSSIEYGTTFEVFKIFKKLIQGKVGLDEIIKALDKQNPSYYIEVARILIFSYQMHDDALVILNDYVPKEQEQESSFHFLKYLCQSNISKQDKSKTLFIESISKIKNKDMGWVSACLFFKKYFVFDDYSWLFQTIQNTDSFRQINKNDIFISLILLMVNFDKKTKGYVEFCKVLHSYVNELIHYFHNFECFLLYSIEIEIVNIKKQLSDYSEQLRSTERILVNIDKDSLKFRFEIYQNLVSILFQMEKNDECYDYLLKYMKGNQNSALLLLNSYFIWVKFTKQKGKSYNKEKSIKVIEIFEETSGDMPEKQIDKVIKFNYLSQFWETVGVKEKQKSALLKIVIVCGLYSQQFLQNYTYALGRLSQIQNIDSDLTSQAERLEVILTSIDQSEEEQFANVVFLIFGLYGASNNLPKIKEYIQICQKLKKQSLLAKRFCYYSVPSVTNILYRKNQFGLCMKCINIYPNQEEPMIYFYNGASNYRLKRYYQSQKNLIKFVDSTRNKDCKKDLMYAQACNYLSAIYAQMNQTRRSNQFLERATQAYTKLADSSTLDKYSNHQAGACLAKSGNPKQGINYFRRIISKGGAASLNNGDLFTIYQSASKCCIEINAYKEAIVYLKKCQEIDQTNPKILFNLAKCYLSQNNHKSFYIYVRKIRQREIQESYSRKLCHILKSLGNFVKLFILFNVAPKVYRGYSQTVVSTISDLKKGRSETNPSINREELHAQILLCKEIEIQSLIACPKNLQLAKNARLMGKNLLSYFGS